MDKKNLIIKLFKSLRGEKETYFYSLSGLVPASSFTFEGTCFPFKSMDKKLGSSIVFFRLEDRR
jgi:hypothetical protein